MCRDNEGLDSAPKGIWGVPISLCCLGGFHSLFSAGKGGFGTPPSTPNPSFGQDGGFSLFIHGLAGNCCRKRGMVGLQGLDLTILEVFSNPDNPRMP